MGEHPPVSDEQAPGPAAGPPEDDLPEPMTLPHWIGPAIALTLVTMAALAIYTGLRYRDKPLGGPLFPRKAERAGQQTGPPGEPQPGASRMLHGNAGENIPKPGAPIVDESSRVTISNDPAVTGISHVVRLNARRGVQIDVEPGDAAVYVNGQPMGTARQYKDLEEIYEFGDPGGYDIRIVAPGHRELQYHVTSSETATNEVAVIRAKMTPE